jgi:adenylylsulfate kinase
MIVQFCGLSGSGKTTLANRAADFLRAREIKVEIIDGDEYRKTICKDLGFSKEDRAENIRRLAFIADKFSKQGIIAIICAINPFDEVRREVMACYKDVHTVFIDCCLEELIKRDTKGLYKKALLPDGHPDKLYNLTGMGDIFEVPQHASLVINTGEMNIEASLCRLTDFIEAQIAGSAGKRIDTIKVRYNTESNGREKVWRLLVDGKELLVNEIHIRKPSVTSSDWLEEKQCMKHHITVRDCLLHIDEATNKATLS